MAQDAASIRSATVSRNVKVVGSVVPTGVSAGAGQWSPGNISCALEGRGFVHWTQENLAGGRLLAILGGPGSGDARKRAGVRPLGRLGCRAGWLIQGSTA